MSFCTWPSHCNVLFATNTLLAVVGWRGSLAYVNLYNKQSDALNRLIAASRIDWVSNSIGVIGLLLIAAAIAAVNSELAYPGWWALLPTVGAFLLIAVGEHSFINRAIFSNPSSSYLLG